MESSVLAAAKCDDFIIEEVLSSEIGGLVVVARCTREGLQNPNKKYDHAFFSSIMTVNVNCLITFDAGMH